MKKRLLLAMMAGVMALLPRAGWAIQATSNNYHDFKVNKGAEFKIEIRK